MGKIVLRVLNIVFSGVKVEISIILHVFVLGNWMSGCPRS